MGGMAVPRPVLLIIFVGNTHSHVGGHMIGRRAMLGDLVR